jgi:hypothetical protein
MVMAITTMMIMMTTIMTVVVKINMKGVTVCGVIDCTELIQTGFSVW